MIFPNFLILASVLLLKQAACSFTIKCSLGCLEALEFEGVTNTFFNKTHDIWECGKKFNRQFINVDTLAYQMCISDLGLPSNYKKLASNFVSSSFVDKAEFKKEMEAAALQACLSYKRIMNNHEFENEIIVSGGDIDALDEDEVEYDNNTNDDHKVYIIDDEPISSPYRFDSYGVGIVAIIAGILAALIYFFKTKKAKDEYPQIIQNNQIHAPIYSPQGYYEVKLYQPYNSPQYADAPPAYEEASIPNQFPTFDKNEFKQN